MIVVSFYTNDIYMRHAAELKKSCEAHGLRCEIDQLPHEKEWMKNTHKKGEFIRRKMEAHKDEPVAWIDADSVVRKKPTLLLEAKGCDVAGFCARYPGDVWGNTLLFMPTDAARAVVASWCVRLLDRPDRAEQLALKFAIGIDNPGAKLLRLPESYAWTQWVMQSWVAKPDPVIEHLAVEARRRYDERTEQPKAKK